MLRGVFIRDNNAQTFRHPQKAFTLLEFLVASFLALLLLMVLYQAFGEVALFWRPPKARPPLEDILLEESLFRWQFRHLREQPKLLEGRFLALPLNTLLGPLWAIYDLEKNRYTEVKGKFLPKKELLEGEEFSWVPKGLLSLELFKLVGGEEERLPLDKWPAQRPLLLKARFTSGQEVVLLVP